MVDPNSLALADLFESLAADGSIERLFAAARVEELGEAGDVTTASIVDPSERAEAVAVAREQGVVAGLAAVDHVLSAFGAVCEVEFASRDGAACSAGEILLRLRGALGPILTAERTLLNMLGHASGIATSTRRFVDAVAGTGAVICDTRKTTPGLRSLEKYAVRCGGATLHRLGLYDAVLYKDNHLAGLAPDALAAAVAEASTRARSAAGLRFVEVEVETLEQLEAVLGLPAGRVDMVLLDNMPVPMLQRSVALRDERATGVLLEASGGVGLDNVREIAATGVDRISVGQLTHGAPSLDIAIDVERLAGGTAS